MSYRTFASKQLVCMGCGTRESLRIELVDGNEVLPRHGCGSDEWMSLPVLSMPEPESVAHVACEHDEDGPVAVTDITIQIPTAWLRRLLDS